MNLLLQKLKYHRLSLCKPAFTPTSNYKIDQIQRTSNQKNSCLSCVFVVYCFLSWRSLLIAMGEAQQVFILPLRKQHFFCFPLRFTKLKKKKKKQPKCIEISFCYKFLQIQAEKPLGSNHFQLLKTMWCSRRARGEEAKKEMVREGAFSNRH